MLHEVKLIIWSREEIVYVNVTCEVKLLVWSQEEIVYENVTWWS
jgi:hypothetical protein